MRRKSPGLVFLTVVAAKPGQDRADLVRLQSQLHEAQGTRHHEFQSLFVAVEPVDSIRDLGVIPDSELSMEVHISKISFTCFFHLRRLRKLRSLIDTASAQRLVSAFILSRVDYCKALLAGLPTGTLAPLQRILNDAARLVAGSTSCTYVSGIMKSLHWLPIAYRIRFKLSVLMQFIVSNGHHNTDLVIARTSSTSFRNDDRTRYLSHQDKV